MNSLIGKKVAFEGAKPWSCTTKVGTYTDLVEFNGKYIDNILWDLPGYEEVETEGGKDTYFNEISEVRGKS